MSNLIFIYHHSCEHVIFIIHCCKHVIFISLHSCKHVIFTCDHYWDDFCLSLLWTCYLHFTLFWLRFTSLSHCCKYMSFTCDHCCLYVIFISQCCEYVIFISHCCCQHVFHSYIYQFGLGHAILWDVVLQMSKQLQGHLTYFFPGGAFLIG